MDTAFAKKEMVRIVGSFLHATVTLDGIGQALEISLREGEGDTEVIKEITATMREQLGEYHKALAGLKQQSLQVLTKILAPFAESVGLRGDLLVIELCGLTPGDLLSEGQVDRIVASCEREAPPQRSILRPEELN